MRKWYSSIFVFNAILVFVTVVSSSLLAQSQGSRHAAVLVPDSTVERARDRAIRAHTNHLIRLQANTTPNSLSPSGETPQTIRPVYKLPSTGGSQKIAIVDAFDYPTAENDLKVFSAKFGLPPCTIANGCFKKVYANGTRPRANCGWAQEAALDIEWAHAMAPNAKIILVEAASNSFVDLFRAVDVATSQVTTGGGKGQVSMSWSGAEFSTESSYDGHFQNNNVVYFAASGDTGGVNGYPSVSPYVVSAGGTTINRTNGVFTSETGWSGSGGGPSKYETKLSYQNNVAGTSSTRRSAPDLSFDANPHTGVSVYDSTQCQNSSDWLVFGGTSVSSPSLAGIVNLAGHFAINTVSELGTIYANRKNTADFRDILSGTAGSFSAKAGYDFVTGVGSDLGLSGK
jgi:subtilase family serine protease